MVGGGGRTKRRVNRPAHPEVHASGAGQQIEEDCRRRGDIE